MLNRHGTRLEIGTAEDAAELDEVELSRNKKPVRQETASFEPSQSPAAVFGDSTPKPSRRPPAQSRPSSTPPPPPPQL